MQKPPRILIISAGTFGFGTFIVLLKAGHDVFIWDKDMDEIAIWNWEKVGQALLTRYKWMHDYPFPSDRIIPCDGNIDCSGFDFVILAASMSGLEPVLKLIDNLDGRRTTLVTAQKGLTDKWETPHQVVRRYFRKVPLLQYTGAGLGKGMAAGEYTRMIIAHSGKYWTQAFRFGELFNGTNMWCRFSTSPREMCWGGALRTVASGQLAIVRHMFHDQGATLAALEAGIVSELWCLLGFLFGESSVTREGSPERMTIDADLRLQGTRSAKFGTLIAEGKSIEEAMQTTAQDGVIEAYESVRRIYEDVKGFCRGDDELLHDFPFLYNYYHLLWHGRTLNECKQSILDRQIKAK